MKGRVVGKVPMPILKEPVTGKGSVWDCEDVDAGRVMWSEVRRPLYRDRGDPGLLKDVTQLAY